MFDIVNASEPGLTPVDGCNDERDAIAIAKAYAKEHNCSFKVVRVVTKTTRRTVMIVRP